MRVEEGVVVVAAVRVVVAVLDAEDVTVLDPVIDALVDAVPLRLPVPVAEDV